jgi:hypothetical protein
VTATAHRGGNRSPATGKVTVNVVPRSAPPLSATTWPPCSATIARIELREAQDVQADAGAAVDPVTGRVNAVEAFEDGG